jgi:hypothetical protein
MGRILDSDALYLVFTIWVGSFEEREVWLSGNVLKVDPYSQVT